VSGTALVIRSANESSALEAQEAMAMAITTQTLMKKLAMVLALTVVAFSAFAIGAAEARAQSDVACDAYLFQPTGKKKYASVPRQSEVYLKWKDLIVTFRADYSDGLTPVEGTIGLMDAHSDEILGIWSPTIQGEWRYEVMTQTKYGRVLIKCQREVASRF
jgi:hypothetical protein